MKLPSIVQIGTEYIKTIRRFPLVILSAVAGSVMAIILVENEGEPPASILYNILLASILALPLLASLKLTAEKFKLPTAKLWSLQAIGLCLLIAYAFTIPSNLDGAPMFYLFRFFAFALGLCFLFSVLPFSRVGQANGFWQFNKIIVFRIILTGAFAVVLFAGLGLALAALDNLFGMDIPPQRYGELWILINGLFTVGFLLAGIPDDLDALEKVGDYPKGLKIFAQYVLAPLVLVYFVILYAYIAKIIVTWNWPQGWVGRLILGFSATGILALFVLDPIRDQLGQSWLRRAARWYYITLVPLVAVLFLALWRRISEYGLTEDRYLGLAAGVWLAIMAAYFIISKRRNIKIIPASLCALTFLISFGPWGMFAVSEKSQIARLQGFLESNSILVEGSVQKAPGVVSENDIAEISSILWYLREVHGYDGIQSWFSENLRLDSTETSWFKDAPAVAGMMGFEFDMYSRSGSSGFFSLTVDLKSPVSISGYDHLVQVTYSKSEAVTPPFPINAPCAIMTAPDSIVLTIPQDTSAFDSLAMDLRPLIDSMTAAYGGIRSQKIPADKATAEYASAFMRAKIIMLDLYLERTDDTTAVINYDALIMYSTAVK
ncbi:MAG: DUF4153 domain-containing protein [Candidatus Zixiibacteriota bacterium]